MFARRARVCVQCVGMGHGVKFESAAANSSYSTIGKNRHPGACIPWHRAARCQHPDANSGRQGQAIQKKGDQALHTHPRLAGPRASVRQQ